VPQATHRKIPIMRFTPLRTCVLTLAIASSTPAFCQDSATGTAGSTTAPAETTVRRDADRRFDLGWLGLLGLVGLVGLRRQPDVRRFGPPKQRR